MLLAWLQHTREAKEARSSEAGERKAVLFYETGVAARAFIAWSDVVKKRAHARSATKLAIMLREQVAVRG